MGIKYNNDKLCKLPQTMLHIPYLFSYKPTIFGSILTVKLLGSAYTQIIHTVEPLIYFCCCGCLQVQSSIVTQHI